VHHFDESGKEIKSFGGGLFVWPHGIHVDRDGNVWVTDARAPSADDLKKYPGEEHKGSVVVKFSPYGKVLMTIGKPGVRGNPPDALTDPSDVVTDPRNGDVYIAESHTDVTDPNLIGRISVFDKNGKFLRVIGKTGMGPGELRTPHALEIDSKGRLIVADRHNHRIQVLTKAGRFVREYDDFGRTSGLAIDKNDVIYTADSESTAKVHPGWQRGIRIGSLKDGKVTIFIPPHMVPGSEDGANGRRHRRRRGRQHLYGGSAAPRHYEIRKEVARGSVRSACYSSFIRCSNCVKRGSDRSGSSIISFFGPSEISCSSAAFKSHSNA